MASTEGFRLVRCPKCLNILPEPPNVTVYKCGGCGTTLRAKTRASGGQQVAATAKQGRQDSDSYSVATAVSSGVPRQNRDQGSIGAVTESSFDADVASAEHGSNGARSGENGGGMLAGQNVHFEGQDNNTSSRMEGPAGQTRLNANATYLDSGGTENHTVQQTAEKCRVSGHVDDTECHLNTSEDEMFPSETSKAAVGMQDPGQKKEAGGTEHAANKKSHLVRALSRSCDLGSSMNLTDFHSARASLQSKSFRASAPLQSKIMSTVDELKGDLSEMFSKPADCKPRPHPHPPRPSKRDGGRTARAAVTSSAPLAAYRPPAEHSGYVSRSRLSRSAQVLPPPRRGLPSLRSCEQEPSAMHRAPVEQVKRRPPPRNHCLPVLSGAPFVICSSCVSLVQLPADFAVPSRGARRLRCGACSELLSYSYRDPAGRKKPRSPFEGDECSTDGYDEIRHQAAGAGFERAGPAVSYSEEYGLSFGIGHSTSSSTEDGQPLYVSRNSSFNTADDGRMGRDGKLHRLMGYSSASELLRHSPDLFESFDRRAPSARAHVDGKGKGVCVAGNDAAGARDGAAKRSKARSGGLPLHGILKKGIHGLESLKLRS
uniref:Sympathy for the ligule n=1 Tax=Zea mays TaxID=4577 RepID=A0A804LJT9_MAIZE